MSFSPVSFFVEGTPIGQPRARAGIKKFGKKLVPYVYDDGGTDGTAREWKSKVKAAFRKLIPQATLGCPLRLMLRFYMPRPQDHWGTGRNRLILKNSSPYWHTNKPDSDNLAKAVMDALTDAKCWVDDCLVVQTITHKQYATGMAAGCFIRILEATGEELSW